MAKVSNLKVAIQGGTTSTLYATWTFNETTSISSSTNRKVKVGDIVKIKSGVTKWYNGSTIASFVKPLRWKVSQVSGNRAVLNKSPDNSRYSIMSPIHVNNLTIVSSTTTKATVNTLDHYEVKWYYDSGNGTWFSGGSSSTNDKNATYSIPDNAIKVKCSVKPVSKTYTSNNKQVSYWTGTSTSVEYLVSNSPPERLSAPSVTLEKYTLTASIENIEDAKCDQVEFKVYKENSKFATGTQSVITARATYTCSVTAGFKYRVRCRAANLVGNSKVYGEWSPYSSELTTIPAVVTNVKATVQSDNSVRVEWIGSSTATGYTIEYTTNKLYFDSSSEVSSTSVTNTYAYITGLETGKEWYFRVKATNAQGESGWSEIVYSIIGTKPEPPTTWSLTTTAVIGEPVILYWVHNSEDGSKQTEAQIEVVVNGEAEIIDYETPEDKDEEDKIYSYELDLSKYTEGAEVLWRVRTRGITFDYSDWSVQRAINIYAPPTVELHLGDETGILTIFPFTIAATAGPNTQTAITYHISIRADDTYETTDQVGNPVMVNAGTEVYSEIFNVMDNEFTHDLMANEITLENNQFYTVEVTVSMNSGLIATATDNFLVTWSDDIYDPDAQVFVDTDTLCAYITPFCLDPDSNLVEDVVLAVYRREYDGQFVEIASEIQNDGASTVTDPHPSLDYARYRIVARNANTNVNNYVDLPGIPLDIPDIVIQWDEMWSSFDYSGEDEVDIPPWTGSMLRLPYNVDVSDSYDMDKESVAYIGRENPITYYGTQKGIGMTLNTDVNAKDKETVYALRRLAIWPGDVYVREPSGNGYKATINVSMSKKHRDLVIPVTLDVTRVESDEP